MEDDFGTIAWNESKVVFKTIYSREPDVNNSADLLIVSCIQEGYLAALIKYVK
jgi:hypothetical protein